MASSNVNLQVEKLVRLSPARRSATDPMPQRAGRPRSLCLDFRGADVADPRARNRLRLRCRVPRRRVRPLRAVRPRQRPAARNAPLQPRRPDPVPGRTDQGGLRKRCTVSQLLGLKKNPTIIPVIRNGCCRHVDLTEINAVLFLSNPNHSPCFGGTAVHFLDNTLVITLVIR